MRTTGLRTAPSPAPRSSLVDEIPAPALTPKTKETPGESDKDLTKEHLNITLQVISQTIPPREGLAKELAGGKDIILLAEQKSIATPSSTPPPKPPRTYSYIFTPEKEDQSNSSHCITPPITPTALSLLKKATRTVSDPGYSRSSSAVIPKPVIRSVISSSDTVDNQTTAHNTHITTPQSSIQSSNTPSPDQTPAIPVVTLTDNSHMPWPTLRRCIVAEDIPAPPSLTPSATLSSTANDLDSPLTEVPDCVTAAPGASPSQSMATRPTNIRPSRQSSSSHERTSQSTRTQSSDTPLASTRPRQRSSRVTPEPTTLGEATEYRNPYAIPELMSQGSTPENRTPGLTPESRTPSASNGNGSRSNTAASQDPGYSSRPIDQGSIANPTEFERICKHIFQLNRNAKSFMDGNQYNKAAAKYQLALSYIDKVLKTQVLEITSHEPTRQKYFQMQETVFCTRKECLNGFSDAQAAVVIPQELSTNSQPVGAPPSYQDVLQEDRLRTRGQPPPIPTRPPIQSRPQQPIHPTPAPAQSHHRHQPQVQPQPQTRLQSQPRPRPRPQPQPKTQHQPQPQLQSQPQPQAQFSPGLQTLPLLQPRLQPNSRPVPQAQCNPENLTFSQPENHPQLLVSPQHQDQPKPQPRTSRQQSHPQPEHQSSPQAHSPAQPQPLPRSLPQPQPKPRTRRHHQLKALPQGQLQTPQQNQLQMPQQPQLQSRPEIRQQTEAQSQSTNQEQNKAQSTSQSKNPEQMKRPAYLCNHAQPIGDILHQVSHVKVRPVSLIIERDGGKLSSLSATKPLSESQTQQTKTRNLSFKPQIPGRMSMPIPKSHYHPEKAIHLPSRHSSFTDESPEHQADSSQTFDNRSKYESTSQETEKETQSHAHIVSSHNSNKEDLSELMYSKVIREKKPVRPPRLQKPLGDCKTKHVVSKTPLQQKSEDKINNSQITNMKKSIPSGKNYSDISESSELINSANSQSISIKSEIPNTFNSSLKVCTATDTKNTVVEDPFTSIDPFPSIEPSSIQSVISLPEDNSVPSPVSLKKGTEIICESNSSNFNIKSSTKSNPLQTPIKPIHAPDVLLQPIPVGVEKNKECEKNAPAMQSNNTSDFSTANLGDSILDALDVAIVQTHPKVSPQRSKEMSYFRCYSEETLLDYSYNTLGRYLESSQGLGNKGLNRCASRASIIEEFDPLVSLSPATSEKEIDEGEITLSPDMEENGSNSTLTPVDEEAVAESYYAVPRKLKWKSADNSGNEKATSPPPEKEKVNRKVVFPKDLDANTLLKPSGNQCDTDDYLASPYHIYAEVGTRSSIASSSGSVASWSSEFNKFSSYPSPTTPSTAGASDQDSWKPWNSNQEDSEDDNTTDVGRSAFYRSVSSDQSSCGGSSPPVHNSAHSLSASATSTYRELFKIREGVKIFFIHNDGVVTSPWNKPFLSIAEDPSKSRHGQSLLLRVGKSLWSCELVEKSTLVFKTSSSTYLFKETNNKPECAAVGFRVPSSVRKVQHDLLDRLMQKHTRLEIERPSGITKSVSKGAESAATRVNKIVDNTKMEANQPFVRRNSMRALKGMSKRLASLAQWTGGTLPELPQEYESLQEAADTLSFCRAARTVQYI